MSPLTQNNTLDLWVFFFYILFNFLIFTQYEIRLTLRFLSSSSYSHLLRVKHLQKQKRMIFKKSDRKVTTNQ